MPEHIRAVRKFSYERSFLLPRPAMLECGIAGHIGKQVQAGGLEFGTDEIEAEQYYAHIVSSALGGVGSPNARCSPAV